jgi:hypothetical protein
MIAARWNSAFLSAEVEIALINHPSYSDQIAYQPYKEMGIVAFALAASPFLIKSREPRILHVLELEKIRTKSFIIYNKCKPLSGVAQDFLYALLKQNFESRKQGLQKNYGMIGSRMTPTSSLRSGVSV